MTTTMIAKRMKCGKCGSKVWIPKSLWGLELSSCICKKCREQALGTTPAKYQTHGQGEIAVTWYKAVVQEKDMGVHCDKCDCSHAVSPLIFLDCTFCLPNGRHERYEYGYVIPPKA